jgi:hypothetical protein
MRPVAVQFPAFCPNCGFVFRSRLIAIEGSVTGLVMEGNRETCPRCGAWAELPGGTFDVIGDTIHVLAASDLTRERLARFVEILEAAQEGRISAEVATETLAVEDPKLAELIKRLRPKMGRAVIWFLLTVLTILMAQWYTEQRDDSATREDVEKAVERAVQESEQHPPPMPKSQPPSAQTP